MIVRRSSIHSHNAERARSELARRRWRWSLVATLIVTAATWLLTPPATGKVPSSRRPAVSELIYPAQQLPLRFSHVAHLGELSCSACHAAAPESRSSLDNLIPREEVCRPCHAIERDRPAKSVAANMPPARCDACHLGFAAGNGPVARVKIPPPSIKFDHAAHLGRGVGCTGCHGDLAGQRVALATRAQLPAMRRCLSCHDGRRASAECTTCHLAEGGGRVTTDLPGGKLRPSGALRGADHDLTFATDHRLAAHNDPRYCANCHRKDDCVDCHNGVIKPFDFHGNDYLTLHTIDARRNATNCASCHRTQSFCVGCHSRSGVAADGRGSEYEGPSSGSLLRGFHPAGWVTFSGGVLDQGAGSRGASHHSFEAQRNLRQCASCHREQFCVSCHSAEPGGYRVSPHPRNWSNSRRCRALAERNPRLCLRCHVDFREVSCDPVKF